MKLKLWILPIAFFLACARPAFGELTANQIAILANRNSPDSLAVARHYASLRGVPNDHIVQFDLPTQETISRETYEQSLVQPTRKVLEERRLATQIRVLVTTYGVPLRVAAPQPTEQQQQWLKDALERQKRARLHLELMDEWLKKVAPADEPAVAPPSASASEGNSAAPPFNPLEDLERVASAIRRAAERLARAQDQDRGKLDGWRKELARFTIQFGGMAAFVQNLRPTVGADPQRARQDLEKLHKQVASAQAMIQVLSESPSNINRKRAYRLAEQVFGLKGVLSLAVAEAEALSYKDGDAALDNELSLLWWDPGVYRIAGRIPNPLHHEAKPAGEAQASSQPVLPVLMVSRLDAPTPQLAMQLVEQAIAAEQTGLSGKVYLDARGMKPGPLPSFGFYDQSLRDLAGLFRRLTAYDVVLDDTERRFSKPGEAEDAAVYVGWYRLRAYEDAFTFRPGALGYHIASGEAVSVHDPDEPGWCKNALERGITVTLGSTGEPYLDSFPVPNEFLGLLLSGRYALVEAYYLTTRYVSWRMVLFGDPLYNPWRGKGLDAGQAWKDGKAGLPTAPSDLTFNDPIQARQRLKDMREAVLGQIDRFMDQLEQRAREKSRQPRS